MRTDLIRVLCISVGCKLTALPHEIGASCCCWSRKGVVVDSTVRTAFVADHLGACCLYGLSFTFTNTCQKDRCLLPSVWNGAAIAYGTFIGTVRLLQMCPCLHL